MRIHKKSFFIFFILAIISANVFAAGKSDKTEKDSSQEKKIQKDYIKISLSLDTKKPNQKNHFIWKTNESHYKDSFDAISGASKVHSTKNFREFTLDSNTKNLKTPKGLRNLCLFSVSDFESQKNDNLTILNEGKKISISFVHRGNSYKIESDENGDILVPDGFFIKIKEPEKESKDEKAREKENPETEEKSQDFQKDEPDLAVKNIFTGKLRASLSKEGILSLKGKIEISERIEPEKEGKKENPEERDDDSSLDKQENEESSSTQKKEEEKSSPSKEA